MVFQRFVDRSVVYDERVSNLFHHPCNQLSFRLLESEFFCAEKLLVRLLDWPLTNAEFWI